MPTISFSQINEKKLVMDSLVQQFQNETEYLKNEFQEYSQKALADYEEYEKQARADYINYVKSIQSVWGRDSICENTRSKWVEYSDNYTSRSIVDFESGKVVVEIAIEENESNNQTLINQQLGNAVEKLLNSRGTTSPYPSSVEDTAPLTTNPILENLIDVSDYNINTTSANFTPNNPSTVPPRPTVKGKNLTPKSGSSPRKSISSKNTSSKKTEVTDKGAAKTHFEKVEAIDSWKSKIDIIAQKAVNSSKRLKGFIKGTDGKKRQIVQVEMNLVADNLSRNAALYKDLVAEFSQKFQIEQPLIYAIMEQESYFNPEATSWVPAYGLMQLVPKSGGKDAYFYVYKKEWIPTRSYLYNPRNNIELGTAYLRVLMNQFAPVSDQHCRRLCVIAGYNTGAGNVSRSFIGSTNLKKAFSNINQFDYNQLYNHLVTRLPHEETRNYVIRVTTKREKYIK